MKKHTLLLLYFASLCFTLVKANHDENYILRLISEQKFSEAETFIDSLLLQTNNPKIEASLKHLKGKAFVYTSNYPKATEQIFESKRICEQYGYDSINTSNDYLLGRLFQIIEDDEKAISYLSLAAQNKSYLDSITLVKTLYSLSLLYSKTDSSESISYNEKAKKIAKIIDSNAILYLEISAKYYSEIKVISPAIEMNQLIYRHPSANEFNKCQALHSIAFLYKNNNQFDSAEHYFKKTVESSINIEDIGFLENTLLELINVLNIQKKYDESAKYQNQYNQALNDSNRLSIAKYREIYQIESQNLKQEKPKTSYFWIIFLPIVLLISGFIYYYSIY